MAFMAMALVVVVVKLVDGCIRGQYLRGVAKSNLVAS